VFGLHRVPLIIFAMPKSAIFTRPSLSSSRFSGLMSRCTMPCSCAYCSASQTGGTIASACSGVKRPALHRLAQIHAIDELHQQEVEARPPGRSRGS
jgi:hypothetical protein